jgi:hypothetical protein
MIGGRSPGYRPPSTVSWPAIVARAPRGRGSSGAPPSSCCLDRVHDHERRAGSPKRFAAPWASPIRARAPCRARRRRVRRGRPRRAARAAVARRFCRRSGSLPCAPPRRPGQAPRCGSAGRRPRSECVRVETGSIAPRRPTRVCILGSTRGCQAQGVCVLDPASPPVARSERRRLRGPASPPPEPRPRNGARRSSGVLSRSPTPPSPRETTDALSGRRGTSWAPSRSHLFPPGAVALNYGAM